MHRTHDLLTGSLFARTIASGALDLCVTVKSVLILFIRGHKLMLPSRWPPMRLLIAKHRDKIAPP
jgi:hypothetical protein